MNQKLQSVIEKREESIKLHQTLVARRQELERQIAELEHTIIFLNGAVKMAEELLREEEPPEVDNKEGKVVQFPQEVKPE